MGEYTILSTHAVQHLPSYSQCGSYALNPWYLIRSKPSQEFRASDNLDRLGITNLLPKILERKSLKPLFPGYLFGQFQAELISKVNSTYGVLRVVCFGKYPAEVHSSIIAKIIERMDEHNLIQLEPFKRGERVRIIGDSAFCDMEGIFDCNLKSSDRVQILVNSIVLQMDSSEIARA